MVNAIVLLSITRSRINAAAEELADMPGVTEVYSVAGQFDLVVMVRTPTNEDLADLMTDRLLKVEGILRSDTLIAFRVYSRYDLEHMFGIGMGEPPPH